MPLSGRFALVALLAAAVVGTTSAAVFAASAPGDAPLTVTGLPVDTVRGTPLTNQRLATFTDADPAGTLSQYSATIDWGDGTTTAGSVSANGTGGFAVNGTHTYDRAGVFGLTVTVRDVGGATASAQVAAGIALPGGQIAFQRGTPSQIWTMSADGSGQAQLTRASAGQFWDPAWSADGGQLAAGAVVNTVQRPVAVASALPPSGAILTVPDPGVWTMNSDGTGLARLAIVPMPSAASPNWSRDGRFVTYVYSSGARDIFSVFTGVPHSLRQLTADKASYDPAWAPNDKLIAFTEGRLGPTRQHIFLMNPDGSHPFPAGSDTAENFSPAWSPDAGRLAFTRAVPGGPRQLYVMSAFGANARQLTTTPADNPSWSPEGARIAFTALLPRGRREIRVINADGTGEHRVATNGDEPAWRPASACDFLRFCLNPVACAQCPVVALARVSAPSFHVGTRPTALAARTVPTGTAFVYRLSAAARVSIRILRIGVGHLGRGGCVRWGAPRQAPACLLTSLAGTLRRRGHLGINTTTFTGRVGARALAGGHYQAEIVATDVRGRRSVPRLLDFDVVT